MKKNLLLWGAALLIILFAVYESTHNSLSDAEANGSFTLTESPNSLVSPSPVQAGLIDVKSREKAIDFTLNDLNGKTVSLTDYKGKVVYINFWATWCKWCKKEMPGIEKVYQTYKEKDFIFLAISKGEERATVNQYIQNNHYSFGALLDIDKDVSKAYNINGIPVSIFIDKAGNIAKKKIGTMTEEQIRITIKELIK